MEGGGIVAVLALLVPVVMMLIVFVPPYAMAVASLWLVYGDPIFNQWHKFSVVVGTLEKLYRQFQITPELTLWNFFLPVFGPVIFGVIMSCWIMYLFMRYVRNVFKA